MSSVKYFQLFTDIIIIAFAVMYTKIKEKYFLVNVTICQQHNQYHRYHSRKLNSSFTEGEIAYKWHD